MTIEEEFDSTIAQDEKAAKTGLKDGFLTVLFTGAGMLLTWVLTEVVPLLDTFQEGRFAWSVPIVGMLIGAVIKAIDRRKHEDSSASTGLIEI